MFEALKGLNIADPKFYVPVIIGVVLLFIVISVAKKLAKLAIFIAVVILALIIYFNLPSVKMEGTVANIRVSGHEYQVDAKNVKIKSEEGTDGKTRVYLVSGETKIELPFTKAYAEKFIMGKINEKLGIKEGAE